MHGPCKRDVLKWSVEEGDYPFQNLISSEPDKGNHICIHKPKDLLQCKKCKYALSPETGIHHYQNGKVIFDA